MSEAVIELHGLQKSYGKHHVLKGVNMQVNKGDIYGLIGKNGSGKTTLFKMILGLSAYDGGTVSVFGGKNDAENAAQRKRIGFFVGANFFGYLSGRANLEYYRRLKGIDDRKEIDRVLALVGLDAKAAAKPAKGYSLGMKQRLGLANALLGDPELLILDEPTNGLDPQGIHDIRTLITKLGEQGKTIIVSSHILSELENTAQRFGIVNDGVIVRELGRGDLTTQSAITSIQVKDEDAQKAADILMKNGIAVQGVSKASTSLEDFYFSMVGGERANV
ncbi:MAG: ATP-binding cassette domain-containing protein [Lachnospiraceae bacterium]|nr:ATP-binding cassette domain-containing protein [Lachnospiraceae bacterium]